MQQEIADAVKIGVVLTALAVVTGFMFRIIFMGNTNMIEPVYSEMHTVSVGVTEGYISEMVGKENSMPASAAFNILKTYGKLFISSDCFCLEHRDLTIQTPCLLNHLTGRVQLEVKKTTDGVYSVKIHKDTCTWFKTGTCNCQ